MARSTNVYINMKFICLYCSRKIIVVLIIMKKTYHAHHGRVGTLLGRLVSTTKSLIIIQWFDERIL